MMSDDHEPLGPAIVWAKNGDKIETVKARKELETAIGALYRDRLRTVARSLVLPGADWNLRESAAQDAFTSLYKHLMSDSGQWAQDAFTSLYKHLMWDPGQWFEDATTVAIQDVLAEWVAGARRVLSRSLNERRKEYRAGVEAHQLSDGAQARTAALAHDGSGTGQNLGIDVDLARNLFAPLMESDDELLLLMTLRWFTGSGWEEIAREVRTVTSDDSIGAPDVLVRLTRLLRQDPQGWMALATYCSRAVAGPPDTAQLTRPAELELIVKRNGWRDPFIPTLRAQAVGLLFEWMKLHGKLEARVTRESYEWTADERRHLAARRIATGFATNLRTLQRVGQRSREVQQDGSGPALGIWAPSEPFREIARHLPSVRARNADAVRRYFDRILREPENGWLHHLLPRSSPLDTSLAASA
jgi:hypothetical protein